MTGATRHAAGQLALTRLTAVTLVGPWLMQSAFNAAQSRSAIRESALYPVLNGVSDSPGRGTAERGSAARP